MIALPPIIQEKPEFGQPCNGCGMCCAEEVCGIGKMVYGEIEGPCPSMRFDGLKFRCGIVEAEASSGLEPKIATALAIGKGCYSERIAVEELAEGLQ